MVNQEGLLIDQKKISHSPKRDFDMLTIRCNLPTSRLKLALQQCYCWLNNRAPLLDNKQKEDWLTRLYVLVGKWTCTTCFHSPERTDSYEIANKIQKVFCALPIQKIQIKSSNAIIILLAYGIMKKIGLITGRLSRLGNVISESTLHYYSKDRKFKLFSLFLLDRLGLHEYTVDLEGDPIAMGHE